MVDYFVGDFQGVAARLAIVNQGLFLGGCVAMHLEGLPAVSAGDDDEIIHKADS